MSSSWLVNSFVQEANSHLGISWRLEIRLCPFSVSFDDALVFSGRTAKKKRRKRGCLLGEVPSFASEKGCP
jgi:hypothetical protein